MPLLEALGDEGVDGLGAQCGPPSGLGDDDIRPGTVEDIGESVDDGSYGLARGDDLVGETQPDGLAHAERLARAAQFRLTRRAELLAPGMQEWAYSPSSKLPKRDARKVHRAALQGVLREQSRHRCLVVHVREHAVQGVSTYDCRGGAEASDGGA